MMNLKHLYQSPEGEGGEGGGGEGGTGEGGAGGNPSPWNGMDETQLGFVKNKGWESPTAMLNSYQQLEALRGVPADRLLQLPSQDAEAKDWDPVYAKLGRPENADGYGEFKLPEGAPKHEARDKGFKDFAHTIGLSTKQAAAIAEWDAGFMLGAQNESTDAANVRHTADLQALKTEWGQAFDQKMNQADRAASEFGLTTDDVTAMQKVWGRAKTGRLLADIGAKVGEHQFTDGEGRRFEGQLSPGEATAQIAELNGDPAFMKRYLSGEKEAILKMDQLHQLKAAKS